MNIHPVLLIFLPVFISEIKPLKNVLVLGHERDLHNGDLSSLNLLLSSKIILGDVIKEDEMDGA